MSWDALIEMAAPPAPTSSFDGDIRSGIVSAAEALGVDPVDLATAISYETAGTFDPTKAGPTTKWGRHRGLIQFGEPQARRYGVDWSDPIGSQLGPDGAVVKYLRDTGVRPGMGLLDIYSAINTGGVGRYNRSDAHAGGAPGTVRDKVENQMAGHRRKALALIGGDYAPRQVSDTGTGWDLLSEFAAPTSASAPAADWLDLRNQDAIRNQPLAPELADALSFLGDMGITFRVVSGGQPAAGSGGRRTGSTRHDHGMAADGDLFMDGRKLDWNNPADLPILQEVVARARLNGLTGIGASNSYMGPGRFHFGFGSEAVWGGSDYTRAGLLSDGGQWLADAFDNPSQFYQATPQPVSDPSRLWLDLL